MEKIKVIGKYSHRSIIVLIIGGIAENSIAKQCLASITTYVPALVGLQSYHCPSLV